MLIYIHTKDEIFVNTFHKYIIIKMETKLKFLSSKVKQFYFWKWAIPINLAFYLTLFLIQIILLFGFKIGGIIPTRPGGNSYTWLIIVQTLAGTISILASVYTIRLERKFFYFNTTAMILFLLNDIMLGMYVNAVKSFLLWFPLIVRFGRWSENGTKGKVNKIPRRLKLSHFLGLFILYVGLAYGLSFLVKFDQYPVRDSFAFVFALGGGLFQMFGYIEGFMFALISSLIIITMFFQSHSYTQVLTNLIFIISLVGTILAWLAIYHENYGTFKHLKPDKTLIFVNEILMKYT